MKKLKENKEKYKEHLFNKRKYNKKWRDKNPNYQKEWRKYNRDKIRGYNKKYQNKLNGRSI